MTIEVVASSAVNARREFVDGIHRQPARVLRARCSNRLRASAHVY